MAASELLATSSLAHLKTLIVVAAPRIFFLQQYSTKSTLRRLLTCLMLLTSEIIVVRFSLTFKAKVTIALFAKKFELNLLHCRIRVIVINRTYWPYLKLVALRAFHDTLVLEELILSSLNQFHFVWLNQVFVKNLVNHSCNVLFAALCALHSERSFKLLYDTWPKTSLVDVMFARKGDEFVFVSRFIALQTVLCSLRTFLLPLFNFHLIRWLNGVLGIVFMSRFIFHLSRWLSGALLSWHFGDFTFIL